MNIYVAKISFARTSVPLAYHISWNTASTAVVRNHQLKQAGPETFIERLLKTFSSNNKYKETMAGTKNNWVHVQLKQIMDNKIKRPNLAATSEEQGAK